MKKAFLLALFATASILNADLIRDKNLNVVIDFNTKLMWQDDSECSNFRTNWESAIDYCEKSSFENYTDWRLPTKEELLSIVDLKQEKVKIHRSFKYAQPYAYWSADKKISYEALAWRVNMDEGKAHWGAKRFDFFVRCVRDMDDKAVLSKK